VIEAVEIQGQTHWLFHLISLSRVKQMVCGCNDVKSMLVKVGLKNGIVDKEEVFNVKKIMLVKAGRRTWLRRTCQSSKLEADINAFITLIDWLILWTRQSRFV
jgi:hypothetical protein